MRRIRTIKSKFFEHEDLFNAKIESRLRLRLILIGLFICCDCEGRFHWQLQLGIFPYNEVDFTVALDSQLGKDRQMTICQALQSSCSVAGLCDAIKGCSLMPYNRSTNYRSEDFTSLKIIVRDIDQIDRFIHNCYHPPIPS